MQNVHNLKKNEKNLIFCSKISRSYGEQEIRETPGGHLIVKGTRLKRCSAGFFLAGIPADYEPEMRARGAAFITENGGDSSGVLSEFTKNERKMNCTTMNYIAFEKPSYFQGVSVGTKMIYCLSVEVLFLIHSKDILITDEAQF